MKKHESILTEWVCRGKCKRGRILGGITATMISFHKFVFFIYKFILIQTGVFCPHNTTTVEEMPAFLHYKFTFQSERQEEEIHLNNMISDRTGVDWSKNQTDQGKIRRSFL